MIHVIAAICAAVVLIVIIYAAYSTPEVEKEQLEVDDNIIEDEYIATMVALYIGDTDV